MVNTKFVKYIQETCSSKTLAEAIVAGYTACFEGLLPLKSIDELKNEAGTGTSTNDNTKITGGDTTNLSADAAKETSAAMTDMAAAQETLATDKQSLSNAASVSDTEQAVQKVNDDIQKIKDAGSVVAAQLNNSNTQQSN